MQTQDFPFSLAIKFIIIGPEKCGKTQLVRSLTNQTFETKHKQTIGLDYSNRKIMIDQNIIKILFFDTSGAARFAHLISPFLKSATVVLFTFDITNQGSFEAMKKFMNLQLYHKEALFAIVGDKRDLRSQRKVSYQTALAYANDHGMDYFETSAKDHIEVEEMLERLTRNVLYNVYHHKLRDHVLAIRGELEFNFIIRDPLPNIRTQLQTLAFCDINMVFNNNS
jgi:small GTP-binding protein